MIENFVPWEKYPDLTPERLSTVAQIITTIRRNTVLLHSPADGDGVWSLGCRSYERTCHALTVAAQRSDWLRILPDPEKALRFTFAVGAVPCRFYHGNADDPPGRYLAPSYAELRQGQLALELGAKTPDGILRFAVEAPAAGQVTAITLVEMDQNGELIGIYEVAIQDAMNRVVAMQPRPIDLPPPTIEPLRKEEEDTNQERDASSQ